MTSLDQIVDRHILEYESRLKHVDELLAQAYRHGGLDHPGIGAHLKDIARKRDQLADQFTRLKPGSTSQPSEALHLEEEVIGKAGPMAILDAVALQLEKLVERLGR